jgi:hypothetical protein
LRGERIATVWKHIFLFIYVLAMQNDLKQLLELLLHHLSKMRFSKMTEATNLCSHESGIDVLENNLER